MQGKSVWVGACLLAVAAMAQAQGQCTCGGGSRLTQSQIADRLGGRTVCAVVSSDRWQEFHNVSGALIELGNTAGGATVGSWSVSGAGNAAQVAYTYTGGSSYSYQMCEEGSTSLPVESRSYHFCGTRNVTGAKLVAGTTSCGAGYSRP